ncbi:MAG: hypothetical protein EXS10_04875 [Phycisphaerales bacterium]|nr:hypothetical protein [Phycisphaerales bacterium]
MHSDATPSSHDSHAEGHPLVGHLVPVSTLLLTGGALVALTVMTIAVHYVDLGEANIYIALVIAGIKATLVCLFFMHLRWDRPFNLLVLVAAMLFVVLMMSFSMMDVDANSYAFDKGNPKTVQTYLDQNAKFAPITSK